MISRRLEGLRRSVVGPATTAIRGSIGSSADGHGHDEPPSHQQEFSHLNNMKPAQKCRVAAAAAAATNTPPTRKPGVGKLKLELGAKLRRANLSTGWHLMILSSLVAGALLVLAGGWIRVSESFYIDEKQSPHTSEWNYNDQLSWRQTHRDCSGRAQSPIDIKHKNVIISQHLRLNFYNYDQQIKFKLSNAHHTVKMNPTGAGYEQELDQHSGGGGGGSGGGGSGGNLNGVDLNSSSIHDMMTAGGDIIVDSVAAADEQPDPASQLPPTSSQRGGPAAGADGDAAQVGGPARGAHPDGGSRAQNRKLAEGQKANRSRQRQHSANDNIEHEREQNHATSFGASLFGLHPGRARAPAYEGAPSIKLDWLDEGNNEYKLRDIHFHWGERRDNGSEHAIDGRRAAMEMHLVHIKHGLDKSSIGFTSDSVAVIAILIESHRKSNLDFNPIVNELSRINSTERPQEVEYKSLFNLLPNNLQAFYTYSGSLTTPPCYQVVNWIVMAERLNMNAKQIEMFRNLYAPPIHMKDDLTVAADEHSASGHNHHNQHHEPNSDGQNEPSSGSALIMPNVRTLQTLNNRTIMASFEKHGSRLDTLTTPISAAATAIPPPVGLFHLSLVLPMAILVFQSSLWSSAKTKPVSLLTRR